jgi:hypothetical protein
LEAVLPTAGTRNTTLNTLSQTLTHGGSIRDQKARGLSPSKEERKVRANIKWFTSQITSELPGPKIATSHTSVYALCKLDEKLKKEHQKIDQFKKDDKKIVKNNFMYGSHYQQMDQKYMPKPQAAP